MLKNALFRKAVCITTIYAFGLTIASRPAMAQARLSPMSFNQMYELAHEGDVESLRASNYRGMNIDATNGNGDTGLCLAARRRDVHAYNAFVAAGANPYHPCTQNVSGYSAFVSRSDVIGGGARNSRDGAAVVAGGRNDSRISPIWWWIGGGAVAAAVIWALASHGGGGGKGSPTKGSEAYNSLGRNDTTDGVAVKVTSGIMKNDQILRHSNTNIEKIVDIDVRKSIAGTTYMDAILYVKGGGTYINTEDTLLEVGPGTIGMTAIEKSYITNNGYIKVDSYNASGGMVASESSQAINYGNGIIDGSCTDGIALNFSGYKTHDTIFGMYADTASSIYNYGDIKGTAIEAVNDPLAKEEEADNSSSGDSSGDDALTTSDATKSGSSASVGTMIGMEALIVNMGSKLNQDTINVINYATGKIYLSAGDSGTTENEIKVSLIGMGSYLHNDFLNSSFNLNRAESVTVTNYGEIDLSYSGNYTATSATALRKGLGGIVGIRADANTDAKNFGTIKITLFDEYDKEAEVSAGMQSIHGGDLSNSGTITIFTPSENKRINYGMSAVEGTGNNSSLYANINPTLINTAEGIINIQIGNSYGMASFVGGTVKNEGNIVIGSPETRFNNNIAMYGYGKTKRTELINTGTIDIYSHKSMAMQNDYSGGTDITNDGTINVHDSATDSFVFGGAYSNAYNKGIINYDATATNPGEIAKEGVTYDPFKNYSIALGTSIISTKARTLKEDSSEYSSSTTEGIYNEEGAEINMNGSSFVAAMAVEANDGAANTQAKAVNNGKITINDRSGKNATNTIGMYMDAKTLNNASIINNGTIQTDSNFSIAMVSESERNADVINNGLIQADHENSAGLYATNYSNMQNNKDIVINGKNSIGVYAGVADPSEEDRKKEDTDHTNVSAASSNDDDDGNTGTIINGNESGESTTSVLKPKFVNAEGARIVVGSEDNYVSNSYGVYGQAKNAAGTDMALQVENNGSIDMYTNDAGAAIYTKGAGVKITNNKDINVFGDDSYGIYTGGKSEVINSKDGVISVGTKQNPVSGSIAIINEGNGTKITNKGDIHLYNKEDGAQNYAIYSTGADTEIKNESGGNIYLHNAHGTGIYAEHGSVINKSTINLENDYSTAIEIGGDATALNDTDGIINVGLEDQAVNHSNGLISLDDATGNITNKGEINLWNDADGEGDSHAILAGGNITVTNEKTGKINSYYDNSDIIRATGKVTIINNGAIYGEGNNVTAIQGFDEDGKEKSELTVENTKTGTITIGEKGTDKTQGYGIEANTIKTVTNRGAITVHNKNSYGIYAQSGESITNDEIVKKYGAKIKMTGDESVGIYGGTVTNVTNNGIIETYGKKSKAISTSTLDENGEQQESASQTITNTGDLILHNANNSYGIHALGDVVVNSTRTGSIIMGYDEYNVPVDKNKPIDQVAKGAYGIFAEKASSITNDSLIKIYASGNGITGGETITNTGKIYLRGHSSNGIYTNGSTLTNSGFINIDGANYSYGIHADATGSGELKNITITNKTGGNILIGLEDTLGTGSFGIYAPEATAITNEADITVYARDSGGITGGETITNKGAILVGGQNSKGISSNGTTIENEGEITVKQAQDSYGIYTKHDTNKPTITNKSTGKITIGTEDDCTPGDVNCAGNGHGIYSENATSITNYADITVYARNASGITGGQAIYNYSNNGESGAIHIVGRESNGIFGNKDNTSIYNEGKINVDDANGSFGIHADDKAETTIENKTANAKITIGTEDGETGVSAHGIYAVKATSIVNEADITVYAEGDPATNVNDSLEFLPLKASGITGGQTITNLGVIHITGGEAHGIYGAVNNTSITNNNNIVIDVAKYSYGIRAANTAATTIVNKPIHQSDNLTIVVGNEDEVGLSSHGIFAVGATSITNEAAITVYAEGVNMPLSGEDDVLERLTYKTSGITGGQTIKNSGTIHVTGGKAHGIYGAANNTAITNTSNIKIDVAEFSYGIRTYKTAATTISNTGNHLSIVIGDETEENIGTSSHGIFSLGATSIVNEAAISVYAAGQDFDTTGTDDSPDALIYKTSGITGGQSIINSGVIYLTGGKAHGIYGAANNTTITNSNRIRIAVAQDSYGIRTSDSAQPTITNTGDDMTIIIGTKGETEAQTNAHGISSKNATAITNDADITIYAMESTGITGGKTITNNGKIHITGQDSKAIESGNATQITNSGTLTLDEANNSYGIYVNKSAAVQIINNADATITVGAVTPGTNGHGIYAEGATSITNNAEITVNSDKASGITGGQSIVNNNTIHITGAKSKGIEGANEKTTSITNTGKITIDDGLDSYGIYTVDDAKPTITNSSIATIIVGTENGTDPGNYDAVTNGHGIYSINATSITNDADISVYAAGLGGDVFASGITGGETLNNTGSIIVAGNYGHALETHGTTINNSGILTVYGPNGSAGIYSTGSGATINNTKKNANKIPHITVGSNASRGEVTSYGIYAEDANSITNDGTIRVYSDDSYGIYSRTTSAQTIENRGDIYMPEENATGIYTRGSSTINNRRSITIDIADGAYGIHSTGTDDTTSSITNSEDGIILIGKPGSDATHAHGIYLEYGGTLRNDGLITIYASQSYGLYNTDGDSIINNAMISLPQGDRSIGIFSAGKAMITNNEKGLIVIGRDSQGTNAHGIMSLNAQGVNNKGNITVYADSDSTAISGGGAITNSGELYVEGITAKGIYSQDSTGEGAAGSSSVTNSGKITIPGSSSGSVYASNSFGIYATGNVTIKNSGNITVGRDGAANNAKNAAAIYTVKGESLDNSGILRVYAQDPAWGIYGGKIQTLTNSGEIHMYGQNNIIGIYTGGEVTINNSGPITLDYANRNYGIKSLVGPATVTNTYEGVINVGNPDNTNPDTDKKAYGIYVYNAATLSNAAEINVYGSESAGIWTDVAETITNSGPITVPYGNSSSGIYSAQGKSITNSQLGKIIVGFPEDDRGMPGINEFGIYAPKSDNIDNQADIKLYGQGVAIYGHDQIKNTGLITIDNEKLGDGVAAGDVNEKRASKGIYSDGDGIDNDSTGKITIYFSNKSIGIDSSGETEIKNKADITIGSKEDIEEAGGQYTEGENAYGIRTTYGTSIDNSGTIVVNAEKSYGIYSNNSQEVKNSGNITLKYGDSSTGIDSQGGSAEITNSGKIKIATLENIKNPAEDRGGNIGIRSTGSLATISNQTNGTIQIAPEISSNPPDVDKMNYGIYVLNGDTVENQADIYIYTQKGNGIYVTRTNSVTNSGQIVVAGHNSKGIYSTSSAKSGVAIDNSGAINIAVLDTNSSNSSGIEAAAGTAEVSNSGTINIGSEEITTTGSNLLGIGIQSGTITNSGAINLYGSGTAIRGSTAIEVTNNGDLYIKGDSTNKSYGIFTNGGTITNTGNIHIGKDGVGNGVGISGGLVESVTNSGTIIIEGKDTSNKGIHVSSGTIQNDGNIELGAGIGISAGAADSVTNSQSIIIHGNGTGIYTTDGDITNDGTIQIEGTGDGILTASEGSVIHTGTIDVHDGHGIHGAAYTTIVDNQGVVVIRQNGNAIIKAQTVTNGTRGKLIVEGKGRAVEAKTSVTNSGTIATHNDNTIYLATTVTNDETGIIEIKLGYDTETGTPYSLLDGPYDLVKYEEGEYNGIVNNNGYMHTEWGSIVREAKEFTNGESAKAIVNGLDNKTNEYDDPTHSTVNPPCEGAYCENNPSNGDYPTWYLGLAVSERAALYNVKNITNDGLIKNYWGPIVTGKTTTFTNSGNIYAREGGIVDKDPQTGDKADVTTIDNSGEMLVDYGQYAQLPGEGFPHAGVYHDAFKGDFGTITNTGDIKGGNKDATGGDKAIPNGSLVNGSAKEVTNSGNVIINKTDRNDPDKGVFHGQFGTITNTADGKITNLNDTAILTGSLVNGGATTFTNGGKILLNYAPNGIFQGEFGTITNEASGLIANANNKGITGPLVSGKATTFTNEGNIYIADSTTGGVKGKGVFQGEFTTITNSGNIVADSANNAIIGPFVYGNATTVSNDGGYVHVDYGDGAFIGEFGTINNSGILINEGGPIIDSRNGGNTQVLINSGRLKGEGDFVIYKEGSFNLQNGGGVIEGNVGIWIPDATTKVTINNEGGKIKGVLRVYKDYHHTLRGYDRNGNAVIESDELWWDPSDNGTTVNPGETNGTFYCTDEDGGLYCNVTPPGSINVMCNCYTPFCTCESHPNWEPIPVGDLNVMTTSSATNTIVKPVKLSNGRTVNVVVDGNKSFDEETIVLAVEKAVIEQEEVSAAHNSLIWTDDDSILKNIMITNTGTINTGGDVHFGDADENSAYISVGKDGSYVADSFAGKLRVEPSTVQGGYDTTYVNENTLVGENKGVEFVSQSFMFDASSQQGKDGNTDVVMTMKPFAETVDDAQISDYLATNYTAQHGEKVFDLFKAARTKDQLYALTRNELGFKFVPNLAKQSLDIEQTVGRNANDDLLNVPSKDDRIVVNAVTLNTGSAAKGEVVGYSDQIEAAYGFMDKDYDNGMRLGFGLEAIRSDSSYEDGSGRYNNVMEAFVPVVFDSENVTALVKPKAGYARGHYRREAISDVYKADTKEYYYGVDAAVRQNYDLDWFEVEPQAELDVTGVRIDDINETNDGLHIKAKNVLSAQSILSLQAKKKVKLGSHSAVSFGAGGKYIHEFGDNYKAKASVSDMIGYYDIISNRIVRDYGILNMKAQFDYRDLTLDASANMPTDDKQKTYYMFNAKYKF